MGGADAWSRRGPTRDVVLISTDRPSEALPGSWQQSLKREGTYQYRTEGVSEAMAGLLTSSL